MSRGQKDRATISDHLVYAVYHWGSFLLSLLPVIWIFRGGQVVGLLGYILLFPYRRLARRNVRIAFPDWSRAQVERCVRILFQNLVANLLCGFVLGEKPWEEVKPLIDLTTFQEAAEQATRAPCIVGPATHIGNWELLSTLPHWIDRPLFGVIYGPGGEPSELPETGAIGALVNNPAFRDMQLIAASRANVIAAVRI